MSKYRVQFQDGDIDEVKGDHVTEEGNCIRIFRGEDVMWMAPLHMVKCVRRVDDEPSQE